MVANQSQFIGADRRAAFEERILDFATLGDALFQEQVSRVIARCQKRCIGATRELEYRPWSGDAYHLNRQTPGPNAIFIASGDNLDCAYPDPDCGEAGYAKVSFPFRTLWVCGDIERIAQVRGRGFADLLALELLEATKRIIYALEIATFQGDNSSDPKSFDGLLFLLQAYNGATVGLPVQVLLPDDCTLSTTPGASTLGTLTLCLLDEMMDQLKTDGGSPQVIFVSKAGRRVIWSLLQAQQAFNDVNVVNGGFQVASYHGARLVCTDGIPDTIEVIDDGAGNAEISDLAAGDSTAIVAVNTDGVFYAEWTPLTVEPLPKCTINRQHFEGVWDGTLVLECPEDAAMILCVNPEC